jgi:hypothetical protein
MMNEPLVVDQVDDPDYYKGMLVKLGATEELAPILAEGVVSMQRSGHFPDWPPKMLKAGKRAEVLCAFCEADLWVVSDPAPNEIDISGTCFGKSCRHPGGVEEWADLFNEERE